MTVLAVLTLAIQVQQAVPTPAASPYADSATRAAVMAARLARDRNERLITSYQARVSQRMGVGLRTDGRDRMIYRRELVADIDWFRDSSSTIRAVGAREGVPIALKGDLVPEDLNSALADLVLDPASDNLDLIGMGPDRSLVYPLSDSGVKLYRFSLGGSTVITLPGNHTITLVALRVQAREPDYNLVNGTLWLDAASHNLVRAVVRPSRPFDMRRDLDPDDLEDVPKFINVHARVRYITIEYGYYENRWWLPRLTAIDATARVGSLFRTPFRLERRYNYSQVTGGTPPDTTSDFRPAGSQRVDDTHADSTAHRARADSIDRVVSDCIDSAVADGNRKDDVEQDCRTLVVNELNNIRVIIPDDTLRLLNDSALGEPILQMGDVIDSGELAGLTDAIEALPQRPWESTVRLPTGVSSLLSHARYNRVEGLSLGLGGELDLGRFQLTGIARFGLADDVPRGELSLQRIRGDTRLTLTGFRRLAVVNPANHPLGVVNSATSLLAGRDDGDYFRSSGFEVELQDIGTGRWSVRAWLQQERATQVEATVSLPDLWDGSRRFRPNFQAASATQYGVAASLTEHLLLNSSLAIEPHLEVEQQAGTFGFSRGTLRLRAWLTPSGPLAGAVILAAGTSAGNVPPQGQYFLGGVGTLRGYPGGVVAGESFWRTRLEVGTADPAARLIVFGDAGWAGRRADFGKGRPLIGAGVGVSLLDGLVRFDLARALRAPTGWRFELELNALM